MEIKIIETGRMASLSCWRDGVDLNEFFSEYFHAEIEHFEDDDGVAHCTQAAYDRWSDLLSHEAETLSLIKKYGEVESLKGYEDHDEEEWAAHRNRIMTAYAQEVERLVALDPDGWSYTTEPSRITWDHSEGGIIRVVFDGDEYDYVQSVEIGEYSVTEPDDTHPLYAFTYLPN